MKRRLLVLILLAGLFAVLAAKFLLRPDPHANALSARELAARGLAEYLARTKPGHRVLIVSNPFPQHRPTASEIRETEEAGLRGLREGLGKSLTVGAVGYPELKPEALENPRALITDLETTTPLSYLVAPDAFDKLAHEHSECDLIVSLIGLPSDLSTCAVWTADTGAFALLFPDLRILGNAAEVQRAMKSGKLLAFVLRKPGGVDDQQALGKDPQAEFDRRFVLVTPENIEDVARKYPNLL